MSHLPFHRLLFLRSVLLLCAFVPACGCNSDGDDRIAVSGKVTVDGQPVKEGQITFYNPAEGGSLASAQITNGEYLFPSKFGLKAGKQVVRIEAYRKSNKRVQPSGLLTAEQAAEGAVYSEDAGLPAVRSS